MALERLTPQVTDELIKQAEIANPLEELRREASIGVFLDGVNKLATEIYFTSNNEIFSRQRDTNQGEIPLATIEKAVRYRDFGMVKPDEPLFQTLTQAVAYKEQIGRSITRHIFSEQEKSGDNPLGLTASERIVFLGSLDIADEFDDFYIEFNNHMLNSPAEKELRDMGKDAATTLLKKEGLITPHTDYMYSVFVKDKDRWITRSYFDVFTPQIHKLGQIMIEMAEKLDGLKGEEAAAYGDYFRAFKYALFSVNPEQQEKLWAELDEKWMKITGRVQPIHPMETYSDVLRYRVEPAYVLAILDDRFPTMQQKIQLTKEGVLKFLMGRYGESRSMKASEDAVKNSIVGLYASVISGARLAFMFAGENVPNREKVRMRGAKIFIILETFRNRWIKQKELLTKIHGEEQPRIFPDEEKIIESAITVRVAGHESGHNGYIMDGTRQALGPETEGYIEEDKADLIITAAVPYLEHLDSRDRYNFIRTLYSAAITTLQARNDLRRQAYYNSSLLTLNAMIESGLITIDSLERNNIGFHPEDDQAIDKFMEIITTALDEMHQIYDTLNPQFANTFSEKYYRETEKIKLLEKIIEVDITKPR